MKFLLAMVFSFSVFGTAYGALDYMTTCEIRDGRAYGYVINSGGSFTIDGSVWFYFYDNRGDLVDSEDEYEYEFISSNETEEIDNTSAHSRAVRCTFNIDSALVDQPQPQPEYTTSCELRDGRAYGYVHNHGDGFTIDGDVMFYFFDNDGEFLDDEDEYEYEYVSSRETEEIDYTSAPSRAVSCTFEVSGAIVE